MRAALPCSGTVRNEGVVFKLWGHDTGGAVSIVEHPFSGPTPARMIEAISLAGFEKSRRRSTSPSARRNSPTPWP
jgi:hypothetical protein